MWRWAPSPTTAVGRRPACFPTSIAHPLLHHAPLPIAGDNERVQIQVESVLNGSTINLRYEPTGVHERHGIQSGSLADLYELIRCPARVFAASATYVQTKLALNR